MVGPLFVPFLVGLFPRPHRHRPFPQYDRPSGPRTVILCFLYIRLTGPSQPRPLSSVAASGEKLKVARPIQVLYSNVRLCPHPAAGDMASPPLVCLNGPVARPLRSP